MDCYMHTYLASRMVTRDLGNGQPLYLNTVSDTDLTNARTIFPTKDDGAWKEGVESWAESVIAMPFEESYGI